MTFKSVIAVGLVFMGLQSGGAAQASSEKVALKQFALGTLGELTLVIEETEQVANACDLVLNRFEYVAAVKTVVLDFVPVSNCPLDRVGNRQGVFKWQLSPELASSGRFVLAVNGAALGELSLDGSRARWLPFPQGIRD